MKNEKQIMDIFALRLLKIFHASLFFILFVSGSSGWAEKISLKDCIVSVSDKEPAYVHHAVTELCSYLSSVTTNEVPVIGSIPEEQVLAIVVGTTMAEQILPDPIPADTLGNEGILVRSLKKNKRKYLVVTGVTNKGTKNAIYCLMRIIHSERPVAYLDGPVNIIHKPSFALRGMHFNGWPFNHPYSFRNWKEEEWKHYVDLLAYQNVNLLYIWPFMEIIPLPISSEDKEYLQEVRRLVDYAQKQLGMEVWIMQAANRVPKNNLGVANPRLRPYWRYSVQVDRNPADPNEFIKIMESHEELYKIVNNVDGVCTIDTDPGSYSGSTLEEYMRIFNGCRDLLDKYNIHGRQTKLINWMWVGWGLEHRFDPEWQAKTIQMLKDNVPDPWWLIAGREIYLPVCRDAAVIENTIYLRYATIESEPSYPGTNTGLGFIPEMIDIAASYTGLGGIMGNVQCPLLQFPRVYHQLQCSWDVSCAHQPEKEVMLAISEHLYPDNKELIADSYAALAETDVAKLDAIVKKLDRAIQQDNLGRPGLFGRKLFPDSAIVADSLLMQLKLHLSLEKMYTRLHPDSTRLECYQLVADCLDNYLTWDIALGWHTLWGDGSWALGRFGGEAGFQKSVPSLRQALGDDESVKSFFSEIADHLSEKYHRNYVVKNGTQPIMGAVLAVIMIKPNLATEATVTASVVPDQERYPPCFANDCSLSTLYWPGALVQDNKEWIQLTWDKPKKINSVIVYFLKHDSMWNRTIHLQQESSPGQWEDIATRQPTDSKNHALVKFVLPSPISLSSVRIVNLLDIFEIEVKSP